MATVILGTGIIGVSTAYYLSQMVSPSTIHLVEASPTLFASASGYAGGFLAKDWFSQPVADLGALSFQEHKKLAEAYGGREKWGYSRSQGASYTTAEGSSTTGRERGDEWLRQGGSRANAAAEGMSVFIDDEGNEKGIEEELAWLRRIKGSRVEIISEEGSLAQVDPLRLCHFLLSACTSRGVQLHHPARAVSVSTDTHNTLSSIKILSTDTNIEIDLQCSRMIITAGAWSPQVFSTLFPASKFKLPINSLAGHSLVVRSPNWSSKHEKHGCHAVFTTDPSDYSPEIFSRLGGEIYVAGLNTTSIPLPAIATESKTLIDDTSLKTLEMTARRLLSLDKGGGSVEDLEIVRKGLCFRPTTNRGFPIVSRIPNSNLGGVLTSGDSDGGVFLAAGHGPWGISMSVGTGKVMAEMVQGLKTSADVSQLGFS